jgi:cytochrome c biogenesis protein CcmG, thiol:disulfide interchange protein DsbE
MRIFIRIIMIGFFVAGTLTTTHAVGQVLKSQSPLQGSAAPEFRLESVNGGEIQLAEFRKNQPVILFYWATWCPHCRTQLSELNREKEAIQGKGIKLLLVNVGEKAKTVEGYLSKNNIDLPVALDQDTSVAREYGVVGVPVFFLVDKAGIVRDVQHDLPENYEEILKAE